VDDGAGDNLTRSELLAQLAGALGMPVIALVSGWKGDHIVNVDEDALRAFLHVLDAELAAWRARDEQVESAERADLAEQPQQVALYLVGRGGFPGFSEGVCRAVRGRNIRATAVIPGHVDGAFSLVALGVDHRLMHPYAALGAYDRPALGGIGRKMSPEIVRELIELKSFKALRQLVETEAMSARQLVDLAGSRRQAQLAGRLLARLLGAENLSSIDDLAAPAERQLFARVERHLSTSALGTDLALSAAELTHLGLPTETANAEQGALIRRIYEAYERELQVLQPIAPRFTESDIADEVEFAPAVDLTGAIIEGPHSQLIFELDTGRPDPDTGTLSGQWSWASTIN
jgi:hypothetical protein